MKILFIHQNFPGQYLHLAQFMQRMGGHEITGLGEAGNIKKRGVITNISTIGYPTPPGAGEGTHHYLLGTEASVRRGQTVARSLLEMKAKGYSPDVISVHPGWGEALFVRDVYPDTPILMFCEYYFRAGEADLGFDPDYPQTPDWSFSIRIRNTAQIMSLLTASACISPSYWQASRYPAFISKGIQVIHDGVNTAYMSPAPDQSISLQPLQQQGESRLLGYPRVPVEDKEQNSDASTGEAQQSPPRGEPLTLSRKDKVVLFIARNLEPYRGFHVFLRALPELQQRHPDAQVLIVGHDGVSYSPALPGGQTYKALYLEEMRGKLDLTRVHFLGRVAYPALRTLFRVSAAHVYLTYPFVLSWSALESMSCENLLIASDTPPVREMITHRQNGLLVDFFDRKALLDALDSALCQPEAFAQIRRNARLFVEERFCLDKCLRQQYRLLENLSRGHYPNPR